MRVSYQDLGLMPNLTSCSLPELDTLAQFLGGICGAFVRIVQFGKFDPHSTVQALVRLSLLSPEQQVTASIAPDFHI